MSFREVETLRAEAQREIEFAAIERAKTTWRTYEFAYRRRYNLQPIEPRTEHVTLDLMIEDFWAHQFVEQPHLAIWSPVDLAAMRRHHGWACLVPAQRAGA